MKRLFLILIFWAMALLPVWAVEVDEDSNSAIDIEFGGTNATTAAGARTNLGAVGNTGNETVAGIKTFSSFPLTPSSAPTTDYQVANKKYVDDNAGGGSGDVTGPASSTDNAVPRFNGTAGTAIQMSSMTIDDNGSANIPSGQSYKINNISIGNPGAINGLVQGDGAGNLSAAASITSAVTVGATQPTTAGTIGRTAGYNLTVGNGATYATMIIGPASSTDNAVMRFDGAGGVTAQNSSLTVDDNGTTNIPTGQTYNINGSPHTHSYGDASGPGSSTDNAVARFDSTTGKLLQNSLVTIDDSGKINIPSGQTYDINGSPHTHAGISITGNVSLSAASMWPSTTAGAAGPTKAETSTNKVNYYSIDFDSTTKEYAEIETPMPDDWDGGTVTVVFYWSHGATTTNFGVTWGCACRSYGDDEATDQTFGTAQESSDTGGTTDDVYKTSATSAITCAGTPAAGELVHFRVYRDPDNGSDTMAVDAKLRGIKITYTRS